MRREIIKGALRGGTYAAPAVLFLDAPSRVAALPSTAPSADLVVSQVVDKPVPYLGETVTITVSVRNNGPDTATSVQVTDLLPATLPIANPPRVVSQGSCARSTGVWSLQTPLTVHATATLTISATAATAAPSTNTAHITHLDQTNPNSDSGASVLVTPLALVAAISQTAACSGSAGLMYIETLTSLRLGGGPINTALSVQLRYTGGDLDGETSLFASALTTDALGHAGLPAALAAQITVGVFQTAYPNAVTVKALNGAATVISAVAALTTAPNINCG